MTSIFLLVTPSVLLFAPSHDTANLERILLPLLPFAIAIILVVVLTLYRRKKAKERMQIMQGAAAQLGWTFCAEAPWNYIPGLIASRSLPRVIANTLRT
jgi:chromate transport protein ChrA